MNVLKFCCPNCFNDEQVAQFVIDNEQSTGTCDFCSHRMTSLVNPNLLFQFIEQLDAAFELSAEGELLFDILIDKLQFFQESVVNTESLFNAILSSDIDISKNKYIVPHKQQSEDDWNEFAQEIKSKNRFFPRALLTTQTMRETESLTQSNAFNILVESLTRKIADDTIYFRARTAKNEKEKFALEDMLSPPKEFALAGRANPIGIPYLYLADNVETCVAEVRPSNDTVINIARFKSCRLEKVIDLTSPRARASLFKVESESLSTALKYIDLLEIFAIELSKPINPNSSHLDYIPTQFLCEYFKTICGYDGILFNSSFGLGKNLVLFNEDFIAPIEVFCVQVSATKYTHVTL